MQFPDPHFKKRHKKRQVVQAQLVTDLAELMSPGGDQLIQNLLFVEIVSFLFAVSLVAGETFGSLL